MATDEVKKQVHTLVAKVVSWSLRQSACGRAPSCGFNGEPLSGVRAELAGKPLASSWRMCFFGFRFDEKARKETNFFQRSYQHSLICMNCMAQKKHKGWIPELCYKNFYPSAVHRMTPVSFLPIDLWLFNSSGYFHVFWVLFMKVRYPKQFPSPEPMSPRLQALLTTCEDHPYHLGPLWKGGT